MKPVIQVHRVNISISWRGACTSAVAAFGGGASPYPNVIGRQICTIALISDAEAKNLVLSAATSWCVADFVFCLSVRLFSFYLFFSFMCPVRFSLITFIVVLLNAAGQTKYGRFYSWMLLYVALLRGLLSMIRSV